MLLLATSGVKATRYVTSEIWCYSPSYD